MFILTIIQIILPLTMNTVKSEIKEVKKNGMNVQWSFSDDLIHFQVHAPSAGWLAIGFNETADLNNTYLIMGAVSGNKLVVKEHHVFKPGSYQSFEQLREPESIENIEGYESEKETTIHFSLPQTSFYQYVKHLKHGMEYYLLLAYSQEDDFEHHSVMRTSIKIKL